MSKTLAAHDLRGLSRDQLNAKVVELKEELFGLRFQAATGQLPKTHETRRVRREIARVKHLIGSTK